MRFSVTLKRPGRRLRQFHCIRLNRSASCAMDHLSSGQRAISTLPRLIFSPLPRMATYLVKCPACSTMCNAISFRRTRDGRSLSGSPRGLASRIRNVVVVTATLMLLLAIGVAITGLLRPTLIPMCFAPEEAGQATVVCPTAQSEPFVPTGGQPQKGVPTRDIDVVVAETAKPLDLTVIELVGLTAAAIATAAAIRRIKGSSERYGLPVALASLKLPTGAITAFLGLLLMRGQFVPGLSALDTSAQILAWALVFGYAQELFTRLVDQQGQTVLDNVRGADKA